MQVKRFVAPDMSRALRLLTTELGEDAVLLSSRTIFDGVEVLGLPADADLSAYHAEQKNTKEDTPAVAQTNTKTSVQSKAANQQSENNGDAPTQNSASTEQPSSKPFSRRFTDHLQDELPPSPMVTAPADTARAESEQSYLKDSLAYEQLHGELQQVREMLTKKLKQTNDVDPILPNPLQYTVLKRLSQMGLPISLARRISADIDEVGMADGVSTSVQIEQAWKVCLSRLEAMLPIDISNPLGKGGVFSFVGPGASGKTSAIVKFASQFLLEHSAKDVAIINLDQFSIGGQAVLNGFSRISSVPVLQVDQNHSLEDRIAECSHRRLVLIDTGSLSKENIAAQQSLNDLANMGARVSHLLTFSSMLDASLLKTTLAGYGPLTIKGCVLTRLDDCATSGQLIAQLIAQNLAVSYLSEGALLPKHLSPASAQTFMHHLMCIEEDELSVQQLNESVFVPTVNRRQLDASESVAG